MKLILNLWGRRCCSRRDAKDKVGCSNGAETELLRAINYKRDFDMTTESKWENGKHGSIFCDRRIAGSQTNAEVCFQMITDDRTTFCDLRSSAII